MRRLVFIVGGLLSSGSCWVKSVNSGAPFHAATAFPTSLHCPTCGVQLRLTHDRQRNTAFTYWRCDAGHGRFTPFVDFLREKDFIKPLSPQQLAELRRSVQTIHCANCGAPIDLTRDSTCGHCGAALSMLDLKKVAALPAPAA